MYLQYRKADMIGQAKKLIKSVIGFDSFPFVWWHTIQAIYGNLKYNFPSRKIVVIGVTGTNGKTTTCLAIAHLLVSQGKKVAAFTTAQCRMGDKVWLNESKMTTLGRAGVQKFIFDAVVEGCEYVVLETSSHALYYGRTWGVAYDVCVFTNLTQDHLDLHRTMERYAEAKKILFMQTAKSFKKDFLDPGSRQSTALSGMTEGKPGRGTLTKGAVVNIDDAYASRYLGIDGLRYITVGQETDKTPTYLLSNLTTQVDGIEFNIIQNEKPGLPLSGYTSRNDIKVKSVLMGEFNMYNLAEAVATGELLGFERETLCKSLETFSGVPGRLERVENTKDLTILVDYAHTADALDQVLSMLYAVKTGSLKIVFGATGDRDKDKRPKMAAVAAKYCDEIIITTDDPYTESAQTIADEVYLGIPEDKKAITHIVLDRKEAIVQALKNSKPHDMILIAGKGCEPVMVVGDQKIPWSDRGVVEEYLKQY